MTGPDENRTGVTGRAVLAVLCLALLISPAAAAADKPAPDNLDAVQRQLESERAHDKVLKQKEDVLRREAKTARRERIHAARAIQDHEEKVGALAAELIDLARAEASAVRRLAENRVSAAKVTMALQQLARNPPEAMLAQPLSASEMVRSAILLRAAVPGIEARVSSLRVDLDALTETRTRISSRRLAMSRASDALRAERRRLDSLFTEKKRAIASVEAERAKARRRLARLADKAKTLQDLLQRIEKDNKAQLRIKRDRKKRVTLTPPKAVASAPSRAPALDTLAPGVAFAEARGKVTLPVVGRLVQRYGEKADTGFRRKGLSFTTLREAQVVAPYDGKVVYADKFRGYGLLLILDHGGGYHSLLAGMARVDGVLGQRVLAGEPVGVMGAGGNPSGPELYVEFRRNGNPFNPMPWMAARKGKGTG